MIYQKTALINQLLQQGEEQLQQVDEYFRDLNTDQLFWRPVPSKWGVADCFEHIDRFLEMYLQRIERELVLAEQRGVKPADTLQTGFFGDYMARSLDPGPQRIIRMKVPTFRLLNPIREGDSSPRAVTNFERQLKRLVKLMKDSERVNLTRVRVTSAMGPILRFRLGDAYRIIIAHNDRHLLQARHVLGQADFPR